VAVAGLLLLLAGLFLCFRAQRCRSRRRFGGGIIAGRLDQWDEEDRSGSLPVTFELCGGMHEHGALTSLGSIADETQLRSRLAELAFALLIDPSSELGGRDRMRVRYTDGEGRLRDLAGGCDVSAVLGGAQGLRVMPVDDS
jgi:hypothetical protein